MTDGEIVAALLARDESALDELREKYGGKLCAIAFGILGDRETAEECVNDAYFAAWNAVPPHEPTEYLPAFLAKLVRSAAINRIKAGAAAKRSAEFTELSKELESCLPSPYSTETEVESRELMRAVSSFLRGISTEKRAVFVRRYWYMEPVKTIALNCGMTQSKVKSMLFRVRNELRQYLEKEGHLL